MKSRQIDSCPYKLQFYIPLKSYCKANAHPSELPQSNDVFWKIPACMIVGLYINWLEHGDPEHAYPKFDPYPSSKGGTRMAAKTTSAYFISPYLVGPFNCWSNDVITSPWLKIQSHGNIGGSLMQSSTPFPQTKSEHTVSLIPNGLLLVAAQRKKSDLRLICVFYNRLGVGNLYPYIF